MTESKFAKNTSVLVSRSREEIARTMARYGADCFGYLTEPEKASVVFRLEKKYYRLIPIPDDPAKERQIWRVLLLLLKAKMESVAAGVSTAEQEFLGRDGPP